MLVNFTKMHGIGNDYIYINCFNQVIDNPEQLAVKLSDRHFGIGGDGIVLILPSLVADARMRMFNLDGSEGKMCGNAIRCVAKYIYDNKLIDKTTTTIETLSGIKELELYITNDKVSSVMVDMGKPQFEPSCIPVNLNLDKVIDYPITIDNEQYNITCVSVGNPHCVTFLDELDSLRLDIIGPEFENYKLFPEKINTEFVQIIDKRSIQMRVWERGSGETLACGTGACASVVASVLNGYVDKNQDIKVILKGGELIIRYTDNTVYMTGPCEEVFSGQVFV